MADIHDQDDLGYKKMIIFYHMRSIASVCLKITEHRDGSGNFHLPVPPETTTGIDSGCH